MVCDRSLPKLSLRIFAVSPSALTPQSTAPPPPCAPPTSARARCRSTRDQPPIAPRSECMFKLCEGPRMTPERDFAVTKRIRNRRAKGRTREYPRTGARRGRAERREAGRLSDSGRAAMALGGAYSGKGWNEGRHAGGAFVGPRHARGFGRSRHIASGDSNDSAAWLMLRYLLHAKGAGSAQHPSPFRRHCRGFHCP